MHADQIVWSSLPRFGSWKWLWNQFIGFNWANAALLVAILALTVSIKSSLNDQQAAHDQTVRDLKALQVALSEAAQQTDYLTDALSRLGGFNQTLNWAVANGLPQLAGFAWNFSIYSTETDTLVSTVAVLNTLDSAHVVGDVSGLGTSFANSWTTYVPAPATFWRDRSMVHLYGCIQSGTMGQAAFTLPSAYLPAHNRYFAVYTTAGVGQVAVQTDGLVIPANPATTPTAFCLDHSFALN